MGHKERQVTTARLWCGCVTVSAGLLADALAVRALSPARKVARGVASAGRPQAQAAALMDDAAARRERLRALRAAAAEAGEDGPQPAAQPAAPEEPQLRFRNYNVHDKKHIAHSTMEAAQPPKFEEPRADPGALPLLDADVSRPTTCEKHRGACSRRGC